MNQEGLTLSSTIQDVQNRLSKQESVTSYDVVNALLKLHPEYSNSYARGKSDLFAFGIGIQKHINQWLDEVKDLFDYQKITLLHGRLVIIGLGILDEKLGEEMSEDEFLSNLVNELNEPLSDILSSNGFSLYVNSKVSISADDKSKSGGNQSQTSTHQKISSDRIGSYSDSPEKKIEDDKLGRAAYARYLVQRILAVDTSEAFSMHLGGPWGSGKSTLLNFMKSEFKEWIRFNYRSN